VYFPQALTLLREWCRPAPLLNAVFDFYRMQLQHYNDPITYLDQRGIYSPGVIEHMRIGYAPGGCLRSWLTQLGYPLSVLRSAGLITAAGYDSTPGASPFPSKVISMAAAFEVRRHRTGFCRNRKAVCTCGKPSGNTQT